jgi:triacylglycerol lipase
VIWGEARMGAEAAALLGSPVWRGNGVPYGSGRPVLLIPGFLAGDASLALMSQWLRRVGYRTHGSGITSNVECSERAVTKLEARVIDLSERYGQPVSIIGHSRGGMFGRVLAVRHPDRVAQVVALASPLVPSLDDLHPLLRLQIRALQRVQRASGEGLLASACEQSFEAYNFGLDPIGCCTQFWTDLDDDVPAGLGFTSIYSRSDGVLHWRCCLDPRAEHVEVESSHCGMAFNAKVFRAVGSLLAQTPFVFEDAPELAEAELAVADPAPKRRRAAASSRTRVERVATS